MYYLLTALLLAFGIYTLVGNFITFPTKRTEKAMSTFKHKQGKRIKIEWNFTERLVENVICEEKETSA